jgi:hypothetical protein
VQLFKPTTQATITNTHVLFMLETQLVEPSFGTVYKLLDRAVALHLGLAMAASNHPRGIILQFASLGKRVQGLGLEFHGAIHPSRWLSLRWSRGFYISASIGGSTSPLC